MVGVSSMADGVARERLEARKPRGAAGKLSCSVSSGGALDSHTAICRHGLFSAAQSPAWMAAWVGNVAPDSIVATLSIDGEPVFALALEIVRAGPFKIARFMGSTHANGNFPAVTPEFIDSASAADFRSLFKAVHEARPDIDLVALERMVSDLDGTPNPLLALPHAHSPNLSLEVGLKAGFDTIVGRSKSLGSKHRSRIRKYEASGGYRRIEARTAGEVRALLEAFLVQKEVRLRKMGIPNVFGDPKIQKFLHALFAGALGPEKPAYLLHGLEVGGKLRAISGSSRCGARITCDIVSIADDDLARTAPGEFLFYENIRAAAEDGLEVYDFGVGDEPHKRRWCDTEIQHLDVLVPLSVKGYILAWMLRAKSSGKAVVKSNPVLWRMIKTLRKRAAAEKAEASNPSD